MQNSQEVIIIIVNYNSYKHVKKCLESIKKNENKSPLIVIVDNNSSDADQLSYLKNIYPKIHIIKNSSNFGFARANNIGIRWAKKNKKFEFLLLLNADTIIEENAISNLIKPLRHESDIGITTSKIMYAQEKEIVWYGGAKINYKRGWPKIIDYNQPPTVNGANKSKYVSFISGCVMLFSKQALRKLQGFDDRFFMYCEDLELSMRANKKGINLWYEASSIIYHTVQGSFTEKNKTGFHKDNPNLPFIFYHMKLNQWLTMKKHLSKNKFLIFNFFYWSELLFYTLRFLKWRRFDLIKKMYLIVKNILKRYWYAPTS